MSGINDPLQKPMSVEAQDSGISPLDLVALPLLPRKIMRYILREHEAGYPTICQWAAALPEEQRPTQAELDQSLEVLSEQLWLIKHGKGKRARYHANLSHKAGSKLAQGVWSVLDDLPVKKDSSNK
jgi:hypothetical protein